MTTLSPRFKAIGLIGRGAEGEVFEVEDRIDGSRYALKKRPFDPAGLHELGALWAELVDSGLQNLLIPLACRLPGDHSLETLLPLIRSTDPRALVRRDGPELAFSLLLQTTHALSVLHAAGYCHRDVKPDNILVESTNRSEPWANSRAILADLDLAQRTPPQKQPAGASGTLGYMAPEVLEGGSASPSSDLFALGMWLYWLITGEEPLRRDTLLDSIRATRDLDRLPSVSRVDQRFAGGTWEEILATLIRRDPAARPASAREFHRYLVTVSPQVLREPGAISEMLWTPDVLTETEQEAIDGAVRFIQSEAATSTVGCVHLARPESTRALYQRLRLELRSAGFESIYVRSSYGFARATSLVSGHAASLVFIDNGSAAERFDSAELRALVAVARLGADDAKRIVIVDSRAIDAADDQSVPTDQLKMISGVAHGDIHQHRAWMRALFSHYDLSSSLSDIVVRYAGQSASATTQSLRSLLNSNAIAPEGDCLVLLEGRALAGRWNASGAEIRWSRSESHLESELLELLLGQPYGLPLALVEACYLEFPGLSGTVRRLIERGTLAIDRERSSLVSMPLAPTEPVRGRPTEASNPLPGRVLVLAGEYAAHELDPVSELALAIRSDRVSPSLLKRIIAAARLLLYRGEAERALALCFSATLGAHTLMGDYNRARLEHIRARALSVLGERAHLDAIWTTARDAAQSAGRLELAARIELDAQHARLSRSPGFTRDAVQLLDLSGADSAPRLRAELALEELSIEGWHNGFARVEAAVRAQLSRPQLADRCVAVGEFCLAKAAESRGDVEAVRRHCEVAILHAKGAAHARTLARVVGFASGFELVRGRVRLGRRILAGLDFLPRKRFSPADLLPILSSRGGIEFEGGNLHSALRSNQELLSLAIATSHRRLETNTRRNTALICLEMNRLADALASLAPGALGHPHLIREGSYWDRRVFAMLLTEVGRVGEAAAELHELSALPEAGSRFQRADLRARLARVAFIQGDQLRGRELVSEALGLFNEEGALDEELKLALFAARFAPESVQEWPAGDSLSSRARAGLRMGQVRVWREFRLFAIGKMAQVSAPRALRAASRLLTDLRAAGEGLLELDVLYAKAELEARVGEVAAAADTIRNAMRLLRQAADGLAGYPGLRETYLADPRRQRFLGLARSLKDL